MQKSGQKRAKSGQKRAKSGQKRAVFGTKKVVKTVIFGILLRKSVTMLRF